MDVREISSAELRDDGDRWTTPELQVERPGGCRFFVMDNQLRSIERTDSAALVPIFWVDPERERSMDYLWSKYPESFKFVVKDKPRQGYVGYARID